MFVRCLLIVARATAVQDRSLDGLLRPLSLRGGAGSPRHTGSSILHQMGNHEAWDFVARSRSLERSSHDARGARISWAIVCFSRNPERRPLGAGSCAYRILFRAGLVSRVGQARALLAPLILSPSSPRTSSIPRGVASSCSLLTLRGTRG